MKLFFIFALIFFVPSSFAAGVEQNNGIDEIITAFQEKTKTWEPIIHGLTMNLFWGLATISFVWTFIQLVIKEGTGLVDVLAELTRRVMLIGFSLWMLNEAPDLARALINSFVYAGTKISGGAVAFSPSNVLELGMNIITIAWKSTSFIHPIDSLMMRLSALIVLVCFAIMAMEMTILIVSGYLIVSGGLIAMGFLGSEWTRDHAINYFTAVLGVAFKMFIMQLIFIVGYAFIKDWGGAIGSQSANIDYITMLGASILFAGLMREIPQLAASLASGRFTMQGGGLGAVGGAIGGAAMAAVTGGASLAAGAALMKDAMSEGGAPDSGGGSASSPSPEIARAIDTGPGDDGKAFEAHMQAQSAGGDAGQAGGVPGKGGGPSGTASASAGTPSHRSGATQAIKKAALEHLATRHAFGAVLAKGARALGEKPVDLDTASAEDINRQLNAAATPRDATPSSSAKQQPANEFNDNITPHKEG